MSNKGQTITSLADLGKMVDKAKLKSNNIGQHSPMQNQEWYDEKLNTESQATHNPNPFDFVFFAKAPKPYTLEELNKNFGYLQSGYIEVTLKALTHIHIVGKQDPVNNRIGEKIFKSYFYQQDGQPCIPGSSIRGMLRSFIEAVTNGWVSQAQDKDKQGNNVYKSERGVRHIEFASWGLDNNGHDHGCISGQNYKPSPAIPVVFKPSLSGDEMDIATYLFGYVDSSKDKDTHPARAGKVIIEDVYFNNSLLKDNCKMVDVEGKAIMGGPRPRANWWHMRPKEVWDRSVRDRNGNPLRDNVAHIVGDEFWGRKFYYHQDPEKCISWYKNPENWPLARGVTIYDYNIQYLKAGNSIGPFRIYFDRVPAQLIQLLCTCLCMPVGSNMKHKLGYGRAFGYGSVEFSITLAMLRDENPEDWPKPLSSTMPDTLIKTWTDTTITPFIDEPSLNKLARILTWSDEDNKDIIFTYPPYDRQNFQRVIQTSEFPTSIVSLSSPKNNVDENEAIDVAKQLWNKKKPIHFPLYQARAKGYDIIRKRTP